MPSNSNRDEEYNEKEKNNIEAALVSKRAFVFFCTVYTCSYLSSELAQRDREQRNKGGRRGMWSKGEKEGRHTITTKAKPVTPAFQSFFRGWGGGGMG